MKIKKGDTIIVISGKDRGKEGAVLHAFPQIDKVLVDGINVVTRHQKSKKQGSRGQIIEKSTPIHVSNVALKGKDGKPARVGYVIEGEGAKAKKVRITRPSGDKV